MFIQFSFPWGLTTYVRQVPIFSGFVKVQNSIQTG
jgi:hypothetical protein